MRFLVRTMIEKLPADCSRKSLKVIQPGRRPWALKPKFTVSAILLACLGLLGSDAHALALGRVSVLSALGEPLRAEIDIPDINPDEVASLRLAVGSIEAFRRAGLEYSNLLSGVQVTLQRKTDGRAYLGLVGDRIINEPYLDLVVEATWAAGRLVRDYTLLFDPPQARQATPAIVTAPVISRATPTSPQATASPQPAPLAPPAATPATSTPRSTPGDVQLGSPRKNPPQKQITPQSDQKITVRTGDTASKIAAQIKPTTASLDQMLVALLRENPDAFANNVNRLKAGAVLNVPTAEQVRATPELEASQIIEAQSRDFNDFRRKFAEGVQAVKVEASQRVATGKVQTKVEDKKPASTAPDKLSLQKGELLGKVSQEKLAAELQAREASKRLDELNKNIADLKKLAPVPAPAASATAAPASAAPATSSTTTPDTAKSPTVPASVPLAPPAAIIATPPVISVPAVTVTPTSAASTPNQVASAAQAAASAQPEVRQQPAAMASAAAPITPPASAASTAQAPASAVESDLLSDLLENPVIPAAAGGLVALLAGLAFYRMRQRKKANHVDSSFMESRLQPDSFFDASGGQKIDTDEAVLEDGSSLAYTPSQMGGGADVDPVAEADVYLAYGRDLQAEEILKEALRTDPSRSAIHFKLLQIYAKRHDVKGYAVTAANAFKLTGGLGSDWAQACEVGRAIDPTNPLYQADSPPSFGAVASAAHASTFENAEPYFSESEESPSQSAPPVDLDLDLDFSEPPSPQLRSEGLPMASQTPALEFEQATPDPVALDDTHALPALEFDTPETEGAVKGHAQALDFSATEMLNLSDASPLVDPSISSKDDMLEFDLDSLSLDLDDSVSTEDAELEAVESDDGLNGEDPLTTKLALAEEFQAIGDDDGARTLAQEVADAATGNLKTKAQRFLAELG